MRFLAVPSIVLLYVREINPFPLFSSKVIGHQWYWEYEYSNPKGYKELIYRVGLCSKEKSKSV